MSDYSIYLIEIDKTITAYRKAILKNDLKSAVNLAFDLKLLSAKLSTWTEEAYLDGHESRT